MILETQFGAAGTPERWYSVSNANGTDAFAARIVEEAGVKRIEVAWTQSLRHLTRWMAEVQRMEGGAGSIHQIVGKASAGLEMGIVSGRIGSSEISRRLEKRLGGNWNVKLATYGGVVNIIATRS